jgi:hypothetical protein
VRKNVVINLDCGCRVTYYAPRFKDNRLIACERHGPRGILIQRRELMETAKRKLKQEFLKV